MSTISHAQASGYWTRSGRTGALFPGFSTGSQPDVVIQMRRSGIFHSALLNRAYEDVKKDLATITNVCYPLSNKLNEARSVFHWRKLISVILLGGQLTALPARLYYPGDV